MFLRFRHVAALSLLSLFVVPVLGQEEKATGPKIEPEAEAALKRMSTHLAGLKQFHFEAEVVFDDVLDTGQKLQLSNRLSTDVRRPNRIKSRAEGDTANKLAWYDGQKMAVVEKSKNVYSIIDVPNTIDAMLDYVVEQYALTVPIADFLFSDPYATLTADVLSGGYVGMHRVGPYKCHHLAFSQEVIDWQIWIEDGDHPFPRKLLITYKDVPGEPQYTATFVKWDHEVKFDDKHFAFEPPKEAEKIDMLPLITPDRPGEAKPETP